MSVNDTDNPQVPSDGKVVDWVQATRERLAAEEGSKASSQSVYPEPEDDIPAEQNFEVVLVDGETGGPGAVLNFSGYLVATSVFVGFADKDGIIGSMVPMNRVLYVRAVETGAA